MAKTQGHGTEEQDCQVLTRGPPPTFPPFITTGSQYTLGRLPTLPGLNPASGVAVGSATITGRPTGTQGGQYQHPLYSKKFTGPIPSQGQGAWNGLGWEANLSEPDTQARSFQKETASPLGVGIATGDPHTLPSSTCLPASAPVPGGAGGQNVCHRGNGLPWGAAWSLLLPAPLHCGWGPASCP